MSVHPQKNANGKITSFRAVAAKVNGKQIRKSFKTRNAAMRWIKAKRAELERNRGFVIAVPDNARSDIMECLDLLEPYGIRLIDAVRGYIEFQNLNAENPWTFYEATAHFLKSRQDKGARPEYLKAITHSLQLASKTFGERRLDDITTEELEAWIRARGRPIRNADRQIIGKQPIAPATWRTYRRELNMLFRFSLEREHSKRNPAKPLPEPMDDDLPVKILTAQQLRKLLEVASKPLVQIHIAVMAFAGVRPYEILELSKNSIDFGKGFLYIQGLHSKSRKRRRVTLTPNLVAWLEKGVENLGVIGFYWKLRRMLENAATRAGVALTQDVLRHSFGSHHLALHHNAAATALQMGNSETTVFRHYRELVSTEEAEAYFGILPP